MENILRNAVQQRRQILIDKLIKIGVFKKDDRHLYEWTLSDLEEEYNFIEANHLASTKEQDHNNQHIP
ncbi:MULTISPECIES: Fur-regulated basic protein FbpA [Bacillaceae]|uniref:Fur-regulated basic protein FbpA n=1 Tax=Bacillaceae TaxID=186817 RepID=UPI0008804290|nr:Fur-regulated basic protein FbpA [Bacillus sp. OK048]SDM36480.1 Fur-regulated basic protein A [Bacillus sp. OK048]